MELRVGTMAAKGKALADMMERRKVDFDFGHQDEEASEGRRKDINDLSQKKEELCT